jgi:hypothetical protein
MVFFWRVAIAQLSPLTGQRQTSPRQVASAIDCSVSAQRNASRRCARDPERRHVDHAGERHDAVATPAAL